MKRTQLISIRTATAVLLLVPLALALLALAGAWGEIARLNFMAPGVPIGVWVAGAVSLTGVLITGAATAGLLGLRAVARLREWGTDPLAERRTVSSAGWALAECVWLAAWASLSGVFLLAFVQEVARGEEQAVMVSLLSQSVILDNRALILLFATGSCVLLACGLKPMARATWRGLASPPAAGMDRMRAPQPAWGFLTLCTVILPLAVSLVLVGGTRFGVREVARIVRTVPFPDAEAATLASDASPDASTAATNSPVSSSILQAWMRRGGLRAPVVLTPPTPAPAMRPGFVPPERHGLVTPSAS